MCGLINNKISIFAPVRLVTTGVVRAAPSSRPWHAQVLKVTADVEPAPLHCTSAGASPSRPADPEGRLGWRRTGNLKEDSASSHLRRVTRWLPSLAPHHPAGSTAESSGAEGAVPRGLLGVLSSI